jgi:hypothetical protein
MCSNHFQPTQRKNKDWAEQLWMMTLNINPRLATHELEHAKKFPSRVKQNLKHAQEPKVHTKMWSNP